MRKSANKHRDALALRTISRLAIEIHALRVIVELTQCDLALGASASFVDHGIREANPAMRTSVVIRKLAALEQTHQM